MRLAVACLHSSSSVITVMGTG